MRIVVPVRTVGATDIVARILGEHLKEKFRQPVVVENKPGGNGIVALQETVRAKPTATRSDRQHHDQPAHAIDRRTAADIRSVQGPRAGARLNDSRAYSSQQGEFAPNTLQEVVDNARVASGRGQPPHAGILAYRTSIFSMLQKRTGIQLVAIPLRAGAGGGQIDRMNGAVQIARRTRRR